MTAKLRNQMGAHAILYVRIPLDLQEKLDTARTEETGPRGWGNPSMQAIVTELLYAGLDARAATKKPTKKARKK